MPRTPTYDLAIVGGKLVAAGHAFSATIVVRDGRIADLVGAGAPLSAERIINARGLHVLPGIIDPHVHTRHPGGEARENFTTGTAAAAAGGVTTIFEMPISKTPTNSASNVRARVAAMTPQAHIDFALYGGAGHENLATIREQQYEGIVAYKTFLQPPPAGREEEFRGLWCTDEADLRAVMDAVRRTGLRHCFHCEHPGIYTALQARLETLGQTRGRAHADSRPAAAEEVSVAIVLALAAERTMPIGIVHCSSPRSARLAADARLRDVNVTVETCPPYLFFTADALDRLGPYAKCNPPLRSRDDQNGLWIGIQEGLIEYVGTDHSPFLAEDKERHGDDIFKAPPGIAGLDIFGPLMLTAVNKGRITLPQMVAVCSEQTAFVFCLPTKGKLVPGADADFTFVELRKSWRFDASKAFSRSRANMALYDGYRLKGRVHSTMVRGVTVFQEGQLVGPPGHGRFVRPDPTAEGGRPLGGVTWGVGLD
jgi:dihydropyrimidinase/allantoinase